MGLMVFDNGGDCSLNTLILIDLFYDDYIQKSTRRSRGEFVMYYYVAIQITMYPSVSSITVRYSRFIIYVTT